MTGIWEINAWTAVATFAASTIVFALPAQAQQRGNPCAVYGSDFVAVQGMGSCVRIGGRVRLEMSTGNVGNSYAPSPSVGNPAALAPFNNNQADGLNRAHMRLGGAGMKR